MERGAPAARMVAGAAGADCRARAWQGRGRGRGLRSGAGGGAEGSAQDGPLHPVCAARCRRSGRAGKMGAAGYRGSGAHRDDHRLRHRRIPGDRGGGTNHRPARRAPAVAVHDSVVPGQSRRGSGLDQIRLQGSAGYAGHGLRRRRAGDRRCRAHDPLGRGRRCDLRRRRGVHRSGEPGRLRGGARIVEPVQRCSLRAPRARSIATETALSWAKARESS